MDERIVTVTWMVRGLRANRWGGTGKERGAKRNLRGMRVCIDGRTNGRRRKEKTRGEDSKIREEEQKGKQGQERTLCKLCQYDRVESTEMS
ncbi:hypothetical protein M413DRAFT_143041 [Hebeloma cylindrosporum]|uniref:Uncharacterized protein n=1 Tax=Hebeloma cylindrosporum TaxID=76867 RepID=A0A0C2XWH2_HEBCY|nr:hypothetical protein M413DRAFT_143041 [Hebeloma cylindrosporum h7]